MRVLALDLGHRRTGVAISDASGTLARPLQVIQGTSLRSQWTPLIDLIERFRSDDDGLSAVVVGVPKRLDGSPADFTPAALDFVERLMKKIQVTVVALDERLTSVEAEALLATRERDWRARKTQLDAAAAAILLQEYLDTREPGAGHLEPSDGRLHLRQGYGGQVGEASLPNTANGEPESTDLEKTIKA